MLKEILLSGLAVTAFCDAMDNCPITACCTDAKRCSDTLFIEGDVLAWMAKQEGNDYATTGNAITVPGTIDPNTGLIPGPLTSGKVYAPDPKVTPGFKVGLGVNLVHGNWDLLSEYTYFFSKANSSISSNNLNAGILPLYSYTPHNSILTSSIYFASTGGTTFVSKASSYWSLHFNNINLEFRKQMQLYPNLMLRPHFGFQGSWQYQKFNALYTVASTTNSANIEGNNKVISKQNFWGIGLRTGLDGVWEFCNHFAAFCNSGVSALWGQFKSVGKSYDTNFPSSYADVLIGDTYNYVHTLSPVIQLEVGLQTNWVLPGTHHFLAQVGWEEQFWFFQNQRSTTIANTALVLQGFTAKLRLDY